MISNREAWLNQATNELKNRVFAPHGFEVPSVRVSVGIPSLRARKSSQVRIGECWHPDATGDKVSQIFISPELTDSVRVIDVLAHELIHAVHPGKGHRKEFSQTMRKIGLEGIPTATVAGPELKHTIGTIISTLGEYPHAKLDLSLRKKQDTRMLKVSCDLCGYIARVSGKWINSLGAPICPGCDTSMSCDD